MQEIICYMGQQSVFEEASQTIEKLRGVEVNAKQIERVCHYYGKVIEVELTPDKEQEKEEKTPVKQESEKRQPDYVMMDGSMILTREEKWKEVKLGRIFNANSAVEISKDRGVILESRYIAHIGGYEEFLTKLQKHTDKLRKKIFIADGAKWIWNWVDDNYPGSVQILDFYHAKEHLCGYAKLCFTDQSERKKWIDEHTKLLLEDGISGVIEQLQSMPIEKNQEARQSREKLIGYYETNKKRMKYKTFIDAGYMIGSGAIESAHRTVIQQRLKLSGQRWTMKGAQQVLNLRVAKYSNYWDRVCHFTKNAA